MAAHQAQSHDAPDINGNHEYLDKDYGSGEALRRIRTAGSLSISPELFEKLYLAPEKKVKGTLTCLLNASRLSTGEQASFDEPLVILPPSVS